MKLVRVSNAINTCYSALPLYAIPFISCPNLSWALLSSFWNPHLSLFCKEPSHPNKVVLSTKEEADKNDFILVFYFIFEFSFHHHHLHRRFMQSSSKAFANHVWYSYKKICFSFRSIMNLLKTFFFPASFCGLFF